MTTFRCPSDILITSWLFTARWSTWPGNHPTWFIWRTRSRMKRRPNWSIMCLARTAPAHMLERQAGSSVWGSRNTRKKWDSFTAGTQTRASRARESSVTHKSAITDHAMEENHVIDWDKAKVVDKEVQMDIQMDKRGLLDQEDTDMHESGCRILPTQPHMGPGDFTSRAPSSCKQSRRDQDVRRTSKCCH